jgi:hypothetical protein
MGGRQETTGDDLDGLVEVSLLLDLSNDTLATLEIEEESVHFLATTESHSKVNFSAALLQLL